MKMLSYEDIQAAGTIKEEVVEIPDWGGSVRVAALSFERYHEMLKFRADRQAQGHDYDLVIEALLFGVVEPKLTLEQVEALSVPAITQKETMGEILRVFNRLNAINPTEARKNSSATDAGDSSSPSPEISAGDPSQN